MHDGHAAVGVDVRVGVRVARRTVSGPAGVSDAERPVTRLGSVSAIARTRPSALWTRSVPFFTAATPAES